MLSDAERDALEDIRDNIARAMRFVDGFDLDTFLLRGDALPRNYFGSVAPSAACVQGKVARNSLEGHRRFRQHLPAQL